MRIAFTGSSSTGKTTLGDRLQADPRFVQLVPKHIATDARYLLRKLGHKNMDKMSNGDLRQFQEAYLSRKLELESSQDGYFADRSFVDIAAYWLERDSVDVSPEERQSLVERCRVEATRYDLHIYFPFGLVPFTSDGYRSEDVEMHRCIDKRIRSLLDDWNLKYICLGTDSLEARVELVISAIGGIAE